MSNYGLSSCSDCTAAQNIESDTTDGIKRHGRGVELVARRLLMTKDTERFGHSALEPEQ